jgi:hypothetical protein
MTEGGVIIGEFQVLTDIFMLVGEMISGIIGGEDNRGNITGYITMIFITIGVTGKEAVTGAVEDLVRLVEDLLYTVAVDLVRPVEDLLYTVAVDLVRPVEDLLYTVAVDLVRLV